MHRNVTLSVVSHGQNGLVNVLLQDLEKHCDGLELIVTENIPDDTRLLRGSLTNVRPKGFGANHNAAFERCKTPYFCVCNPDIRLASDPFPALLAVLEADRAGVAGPLVRDPSGKVEDSARRFPTAASLAGKLFTRETTVDYPTDRGPLDVDWLAGMFMLFRADAFRGVGGFDERYFLYYEDVDLCRRLHASGQRVLYEPRAEVIHEARRASRRDPRLALRHAMSIGRYFLTRG
jgi:N-acetylglucosaminyl-diphospho-decaprenol L-rhamnosyltransferase